MAELSATKKAEAESVKHFISKQKIVIDKPMEEGLKPLKDNVYFLELQMKLNF